MATVNFINRKKSQTRAGMRSVMNYTAQDKKTLFEGTKLVSGINCSPASAYQEFVNTKLLYGKDSQRMYYHFVQSFPPTENIAPETAHEIALKLAEHYMGFELLVATHVDREHIHSHFIINSVNFETGKKLHQSANAIQELRQKSDQLCHEYGLSICQPKERRTQPVALGEYHTAAKSKSWKMQLINTIDECMRSSTNKERFIKMMESKGYSVKWTDSRKYITYTTPCGNRCRDKRLHEEKYLKEMMELELRIRNEIITGRTQKTQPASTGAAADITIDTRWSSADTGGSGRTVHLNHFPAGANAGNKVSEPPYTDTVELPGNLGADRTAQCPPQQDSADIITGWETERASFFFIRNQMAPDSHVTDMDSLHFHPAGLAGNLVQLGKSMERAANTAPVIDGTTKTPPSAVKKRKLTPGQKEDDHSGYKLDMKM